MKTIIIIIMLGAFLPSKINPWFWLGKLSKKLF